MSDTLERIIKHLDYASDDDEVEAAKYLRTLEAECRWAMETVMHMDNYSVQRRAQAWLDTH